MIGRREGTRDIKKCKRQGKIVPCAKDFENDEGRDTQMTQTSVRSQPLLETAYICE